LALFHVPGKNKRSKYPPGKRKNPILMKTKIRNSICGLLVTPLLLACFALLPRVQAAPDPAAIPGGNTRDGAGSLASRTTGQFNSAFGTNALNKLTTGNNNAAQGNSALFSNTSGSGNTAIGNLALRFNTMGFQNTAVGGNALNSNITASGNTAVGYSALRGNTTGSPNTAVGFQALLSNTDGAKNTAVGFQALLSNTTVIDDVGSQNTAVGNQALFSNTTGGGNTAIGDRAMLNNNTGTGNTAIGDFALIANTNGIGNTAIGLSALFDVPGSNNIGLGVYAGSNVGTANNVIAIGTSGANVSNSCYIGNIFGKTSSGGTAVFINSAGKLGTTTSSRRFKDEIKPMDKASEAILALKPVTFRYKQDVDPARSPQFGLVAEDVEKVNPDLVVRDAEGKVNTVRYEAVNAMLLNEFLKEHHTVQELKSAAAKQEATIAKQQKQIDALTTGLQKVSDQLELSKPAPQMVGNNR
jgi:hypothetical protein